MTFAITGASGQLGRGTAERLLASVEPSELVLLTRSPGSLAAFADRGVTVREADFSRPETLVDAFSGVDRALLISVHADGARLANQRTAIDAAKAAGVTRIAYTGVPRPERDNPAGVVPDHAATEQHLMDSGLEWTMLRNNLYANLQVASLGQAAESGRLVTNNGNGRAAYVTREDCAAAAAGALLVDDAANRAYDITGPEALGDDELAALAGRIGSRAVEVVHLDDEAFARGLAERGIPAAVVRLIVSFGASIRGGWLSEVSGAVRELSGREPAAIGSLVPAP